MTEDSLHRWRQPAELDDLFLYHLARLMNSAGSMVVRLCEGGYGITRREWRMFVCWQTRAPCSLRSWRTMRSWTAPVPRAPSLP